MDRSKEVAYWQAAADRKRQEGLPALGITFDNIAWLLEHPEGWAAWILEQQRIALEGEVRP